MNLAAKRVQGAILELDGSIHAYIFEEEKLGVPRDVSAESVLGAMPPRLAVHRCFVSRHQRERERRSTNELVRFHVRALRWLRDARRRETL